MQADQCRQLGVQGLGVSCDVTSNQAQQAAFQQHLRKHGTLDIAVLNAGVMELGEQSLPGHSCAMLSKYVAPSQD